MTTSLSARCAASSIEREFFRALNLRILLMLTMRPTATMAPTECHDSEIRVLMSWDCSFIS